MTPAIDVLTTANIEFTLHEYQHDSSAESYGLEAADKLKIDPDQVFKTLVVESEAGVLLVAIVPVTHSLSLKLLAKAAKCKKVKMADPKKVARTTGYVLGGVSPLGQKKRLATFIDESAEMFDSIFCSAGRRGLEIELAPACLLQQSGGLFCQLAA